MSWINIRLGAIFSLAAIRFHSSWVRKLNSIALLTPKSSRVDDRPLFGMCLLGSARMVHASKRLGPAVRGVEGVGGDEEGVVVGRVGRVVGGGCSEGDVSLGVVGDEDVGERCVPGRGVAVFVGADVCHQEGLGGGMEGIEGDGIAGLVGECLSESLERCRSFFFFRLMEDVSWMNEALSYK